jgi:hypothetical protein
MTLVFASATPESYGKAAAFNRVAYVYPINGIGFINSLDKVPPPDAAFNDKCSVSDDRRPYRCGQPE